MDGEEREGWGRWRVEIRRRESEEDRQGGNTMVERWKEEEEIGMTKLGGIQTTGARPEA